MILNVASLNARGLACLVNSQTSMWIKRLFTCIGDSWVQEDDFVVFSAFGSHCSTGMSLLVGHSLNVIVNLICRGDGGWLVVADVAIKSFELWLVVVYVPNSIGRSRSFFQ